MSQFPPANAPMPGAFPPPVPQRKTSGAAIASLVCGILGCFVITPLLAIILGIVGINQTKGGAGVDGHWLSSA